MEFEDLEVIQRKGKNKNLFSENLDKCLYFRRIFKILIKVAKGEFNQLLLSNVISIIIYVYKKTV